MAISEEGRHQLYNRLNVVLGPDEAATLMALLPPVGWADVATKHDLQSLAERIDSRFGTVDIRFNEHDRRFDQIDRRLDGMDGRMGQMEDELKQIRRELRSNLVVSVTTSAALLGAVVAAIRL